MVAVLGLGILFLPESISISSFSNNHPSSSEDVLIDTNTNEGSIEANTSAESYSSGMKTGYGATPFIITGDANNSAYVGTDGYLYGAGYNANGGGPLGIGNATNQSTHVKVGTSDISHNQSRAGFKNPIDYDFSGTSPGSSAVVDSSGQVWTAGYNSSGQLGQGDTGGSDYFFTQVSTGGTNGLPSNYKAVAVDSGHDNNLILTSTGALYGAGQGTKLGLSSSTNYSTFTRLDGVVTNLPAHTTANPIVDFAAVSNASYVLYKNGDLYRLTSNSATLLATSITMFDQDNYNSYVYAVTSANKINIYNTSGTYQTAITPTGTVTQVRGANSGPWGYLNSSGNLYIATSNIGTPALTAYSIKYFDMGYAGTIGALTTSGVTKFWGSGINGALGNGSTDTLTYYNAFTPTVGGGVDKDYYVQIPAVIESGLGQNTPPANKSPNKAIY